MNLILITKDNILKKTNQFGLINSMSDLNKDGPIFINGKCRLLINFPKYLTILNFLEFISANTGININLMKLYEYENNSCCPENIVKYRNDYELLPIDEHNINRNVCELTNNYKKTYSNAIFTYY